jgi:polar amino acid transport system substrate-binding protein
VLSTVLSWEATRKIGQSHARVACLRKALGLICRVVRGQRRGVSDSGARSSAGLFLAKNSNIARVGMRGAGGCAGSCHGLADGHVAFSGDMRETQFMQSWPVIRGAHARRGEVWLWLAALLCALPVAFATEKPVLELNDTNDPPFTTEDRNGFLDVVAGEAFRRVGVELRLVKQPAERALINANAGVLDGDLTRIAGLKKQYPNLVRVPEKLVDWEFTAFSKDASIPSNWTAIRQHSVGHIKGWKIYEQNLSGAERVVTADDPEQLFRLLELNRIEVALYMRWMGLALIRQHGLKDVHVLAPPLATREMFIYLNKRHADLVPRLADALRAMKRDGFYERATRDKLLPYHDKRAP